MVVPWFGGVDDVVGAGDYWSPIVLPVPSDSKEDTGRDDNRWVYFCSPHLVMNLTEEEALDPAIFSRAIAKAATEVWIKADVRVTANHHQALECAVDHGILREVSIDRVGNVWIPFDPNEWPCLFQDCVVRIEVRLNGTRGVYSSDVPLTGLTWTGPVRRHSELPAGVIVAPEWK